MVDWIRPAGLELDLWFKARLIQDHRGSYEHWMFRLPGWESDPCLQLLTPGFHPVTLQTDLLLTQSTCWDWNRTESRWRGSVLLFPLAWACALPSTENTSRLQCANIWWLIQQPHICWCKPATQSSFVSQIWASIIVRGTSCHAAIQFWTAFGYLGLHGDAVYAPYHNSFTATSTQPIVTPWQEDIFSLFKVLLLGDVQIICSLHWF